MGKYGKEFRKNQKIEWKEKYFNYKELKQMIKKFIKEENAKETQPQESINDQNLSTSGVAKDKKEKKAANVAQFISKLDSEIKRVFIFFTNQEKKLYQDINLHLHQKEEYPYLELNEYLTEFKDLETLSWQSYELSQFIYYNLNALLKILKKFDKKIFKANSKRKIKHNYIQMKLEEQNSDILYMLKFKMIDEVCAIIEALQLSLKQNYIKNKSSMKNDKVKSEALLSNEENKHELSASEAHSEITKSNDLITRNVKRVDRINYNVKTLFKPWDDFLKISTELQSKLYAITKESTVSNERKDIELDQRDCNLDDTFGNTLADNTNIFPNSSQMASLSVLYKKNSSIMSNVYFSKDNLTNITITLIHTFIYMFSFSVTIPTNPQYLSLLGKEDYYSAIVNLCLPVGVLLSFSYSTIWSSKKTKSSIIFSTLLLLAGNVIYSLSLKFKNVNFMFIGRLLLGLGSNRVSNKMYIVNYTPKQYLNRYLSYFHILSVLGTTFGFLINIIFQQGKRTYSSLLNPNTYGTWLCSCILLLLLFFEPIALTEAHSEEFSITNTTFDGNNNMITRGTLGISDDPRDKNGNMNMTLDESIRRDTVMVEDINEKLGQVNQENQFTDTNLVRRTISEITDKEQHHLKFLFGPFLVFITIIFTSKVITECMLILSPIYILHFISNFSLTLLSGLLGLASFSVLLIECLLFNRKKCIPDRPFQLIVLAFCFCVTLPAMNIWYNAIKIYCVFMVVIIISSNFLEKISSGFFAKIIPSDYKACGVQGNMILNVVSNLGRIIGAGIPIMKQFVDFKYFDIGVFSFLSFLILLSFVLAVIFYGDLRIKAISRIMEKEKKKKLEIPIEI